MSKKSILGKVGLGVLVLGLPALFLVPYYRSVTGEYERFHDYMLATVDNPDQAPPWELESQTEPFSPEECVVWGIDWMEACPGTKQFCQGARPRSCGAASRLSTGRSTAQGWTKLG